MNAVDTATARMLTSPLLTAAGVPHGFSTRVGGVSAGVFGSLNFGNPGELPPEVARDPRHAIESNFARALDAIGAAGRRIVQVHQVHGAAVHVERPGPGKAPVVWGDVKADAIVTDDPACVIAVRVADCCPVLLASSDGRIVGAAHAGWRGVVGRVATETVHAMRELGAGEIVAAIGPCISASALEVGPEVRDEFQAKLGTDLYVLPAADRPGKFLADMKAALADELAALGIFRIETRPECTVGRPDLFFSHRRDRGVTGRMIGIIGPRQT